MSTSLKIVDEEGTGLNIAGSIIFNNSTPILGMELLERPLYGTEIHSVIENLQIEEYRSVTGDILKGTIEEKTFTITDSLISEANMETYKIEETLFTASKMVIDVLENQISIDLIEPDQYTSSVNLVKVCRKTGYLFTSAKVDLSIKYVKGSSIFGKDLTFEAFSHSTVVDFISTLNDITIEYVSGVVRVIPNSNEVTECIISNCIITYGGK